MTSDYLFENAEHFEEGLIQLVDMLELADPRRIEAGESQAKVRESGLSVPVGASLEEWRSFCQDVIARLRATHGQVPSGDAEALIDAAIDRIEQVTGESPG